MDYSKLLGQEIPKTMHADNLALLEGAGKAEHVQERKAFKYNNGTSYSAYIEAAKATELCAENINDFFTEEGLVSKFGLSTTILMRVGFCKSTKTWKIYLKKENPSYVSDTPSKPSILTLLLSECDEIADWVEKKFDEIAEGLQQNIALLKPKDASKLENPKDLEFWINEDTFYSESSNNRLRIQWSYGNRYILHLNSIKISHKWPDSFGPRIALSQREALKMLEIYHQIKAKLGPLDVLI